MLPLVQQMLAIGYTAKVILDFVSKKVDKLAPAIQNARSTGHDDDSILKFLSGKLPKGQKAQEQAKAKLTDNEAYLKKIGFKTKGEREESRNKALKGALQVGSAALGAYGAYKAYQGFQGSKALNGVIQAEAQPATSMAEAETIDITPGGAVNAPKRLPNQQQQLAGPAAPPPQADPQAPPPPPQAPVAPVPTGPDPADLLNQMGMLQRVDNLATRNPPETISALVKQILTPGQKKFLKEQNLDLDQVINDYISTKPAEQPQAPQESGIDALAEASAVQPTQTSVQNGPLATSPPQKPPQTAPPLGRNALIEPISEPQGPAPGQLATLPRGDIGEIEEIKNGIATVNIDGKKHRVKLGDLGLEPPEAVELVHQILQIPESERSTAMSWFGYDPGTRRLAVQFHTGKLTIYDDVSPEKAAKIAEGATAKTTGQNEYGEHTEGQVDSRGAALILEIVADPKYKRAAKGQPKNANYQTYETIYDFWEKLRKKPKRKPKA
jgi:hypothetical protein